MTLRIRHKSYRDVLRHPTSNFHDLSIAATDNHVDMAWIVVIFNMLICLTSFIMLLYFTHKFSLDTIKNLTKVNRT